MEQAQISKVRASVHRQRGNRVKIQLRTGKPKFSNPRTPKQQEQRGKFATAFSFLKAIKPFIRIGYKEFTQDKSAFNAAMSYTLKRAVTGSGKEIRIDFDRALVSMGTLMPTAKKL